MVSQGHHLKKPNLGNQGQINITVKMHLVIRPVETISIQIGMHAIGKLRISMHVLHFDVFPVMVL